MDNIFSALARRRTKGVVVEFVLWCGTDVADRTGDGSRKCGLDPDAADLDRHGRDHGIPPA